MTFLISCALLLISLAGILVLVFTMHSSENKTGFIIGIAAFSLLALSTVIYNILTLILINGIK